MKMSFHMLFSQAVYFIFEMEKPSAVLLFLTNPTTHAQKNQAEKKPGIKQLLLSDARSKEEALFLITPPPFIV
jgi:hypothetical protein